MYAIRSYYGNLRDHEGDWRRRADPVGRHRAGREDLMSRSHDENRQREIVDEARDFRNNFV